MKADLEWFRTFKAVYEAGTMSDAAKELQISQPSVSLHLNSLETYTGYSLFERNTRKMKPTVHAKQLYHKISEPLLRLAEVENSFRKKSGTEKRATFYIGIFPGLFRQLFVPSLNKLNCDIVILLDDNEGLHQLLEKGSADLIVSDKDMSNRTTSYHLLGTSHLSLIAGSKTDLSGLESIHRDNKKEKKRWLEEQIWYSSVYSTALTEFWKLNFGKEPDFVPNYIIPDMYSILCCLKNETGLAVLPDSLCKEAIEAGEVKVIRDGYAQLENTLYVGQRKNTLAIDKYQQIKELMMNEFIKTHS